MITVRDSRVLLLIMLVAAALTLAGCAQPTEGLKVGATAVPHAEILEYVKPVLAEQGVQLEIVVFNDYVQPNLALDAGELDANFFQHLPYLEAFKADHDLDLVSVGSVHLEPMGVYSSKITAISQLTAGARIAIPNDVSQVGRVLNFLAANDLIELRPGTGIMGTVQDITANPLGLEFILLEAATLSRVLDDPAISAAVINTNFALEAGLNPLDDALLLEDGDSPYANVVVVKSGHANDPAIQALMDALQSEAVKQFIEEEYAGAILPA